MRSRWLGFVVVAITLGFSLWAYPRLPGEVPSHWNLRGEVDDHAPKLLVALLVPVMLIIGNYLSRVQPNWFIGIRTPWTLSSETVWRRTHRTGSWLFVALGVMTLVVSVIARAPTLALVVPVIAVAALGLVVQSYVLWRREQQG